MSDDARPWGCAREGCYEPLAGETTTAVSVIPEMADLMGDGGLIEHVDLLCAGHLTDG